MYFFITLLSGIVFGTFIMYYSKFVTYIFSKLDKKSVWNDDEICYSKHPMSDSEDEYEDEDEDEEEEEEEEEEEYMKDFYEETTFSNEWLEKTDQEKREILDRDLDNYMNKISKIREELDNIKC